jgi:hypothetical protein
MLIPPKVFSCVENRRSQMIRTIIIGSCVSIQGTLVRALPDGKLVVKVGSQLFTGTPANAA